MKLNYNKTVYACFTGYIVQAIVNNFAPLLFLTFQSRYGIPLAQITVLVTVNFVLQLLVDLASVGFVDKLGYRFCAVLAHAFAACGLVLLAMLPEVMPDPFVGLLLAVMVYATGGGLLEVLISPIVEACPTDNKEKAMSLLHSFYCWGCVALILVSTLFFAVFGIENWQILAILLALVPAVNAVVFTKVPMASLADNGHGDMKLKELFSSKVFWILMLLMVCAGASEQSVSQWASTFAEKGLGLTKTLGDLAGPMMFSILMGSSRAIYGKYGDRIPLSRFMVYSTVLCCMSYLWISLTASPVLGLVGCGLCGLSVGILWPGTFSRAAVSLKGGGTAMFALLALAGDLGCAGGPTFVGMISSAFSDNLKIGILVAVVFPVLLLGGMFLMKRHAPKVESL